MTPSEIAKITRSVQSIKGVDWKVSGKPTLEGLYTHSVIHIKKDAPAAENGLGGVTHEAMDLMRSSMALMSTSSIHSAVDAGWPINGVNPATGMSMMDHAMGLDNSKMLPVIECLIRLGANPFQSVRFRRHPGDLGSSYEPTSVFMQALNTSNWSCVNVMAQAHAGGLMSNGWGMGDYNSKSESYADSNGGPMALQCVQILFERDIAPVFPELNPDELWSIPGSRLRTPFMNSCPSTQNMRWLLDEPRYQMSDRLEDRDDRGRTALWVAIERGHYDSARLLVERGACADPRDDDGLDLETAMKYVINQLGTDPARGHNEFASFMRAAMNSDRAAKAVERVMRAAECTGEKP